MQSRRKRGRGPRIAILGLLVFLIAVGALAATYPYWLWSAASPMARHFGLRYARVERKAEGRITISDLSYSNSAVWITASSVECFLPHVWAKKRKETNLVFLEVNGWKVRMPEGTRSESKPAPPKEVFARFRKKAREFEEWVPKATLLNGIVVKDGKEYSFPLVVWEQGQLAADGVWPENATPFEIKAKLAELPYQFSFAMHPQDLRVRLRLFETNDWAGASLTAFYKGSRADLFAGFGDEWLPVQASLKAPRLRLPESLLKLPGHGDLEGSATGEWRSNRFRISILGSAEPLHSAPAGTASVRMRFEANGTPEWIALDHVFSDLPGWEAELSKPIKVGSNGVVREGRAELRLGADLARLPGLKVKGQLDAKLLLEPGSQIPVWPR